jgi:hypothetical protein
MMAAIAAALAEAGISCNAVSAYRHHHIFFPHDRAQDAIRVLASPDSAERGSPLVSKADDSERTRGSRRRSGFLTAGSEPRDGLSLGDAQAGKPR